MREERPGEQVQRSEHQREEESRQQIDAERRRHRLEVDPGVLEDSSDDDDRACEREYRDEDRGQRRFAVPSDLDRRQDHQDHQHDPDDAERSLRDPRRVEHDEEGEALDHDEHEQPELAVTACRHRDDRGDDHQRSEKKPVLELLLSRGSALDHGRMLSEPIPFRADTDRSTARRFSLIRPRFTLTVVAIVAIVAIGALVPTVPAGAEHGRSRSVGLRRLDPLQVRRGDHPAIVDRRGREANLRGVNLNSLGDYAAANPALPTTVAVTDRDWDRMADHGFNVVRLLVSWSRLEPRPGVIDQAYIREIRSAVRAAARRGIYSVIDMHQDAWGKYIASPSGVVCPPGRSPAIGWDGAPEWATITDGADTCRGGSREDSEAVLTAWDSFYADRDGIMGHLVSVWGVLAREFAREPAVAAFDLLNEPNHGHGADATDRLAEFYRRAIGAIRQQERAARGFPHIVMFETTVFGAAVSADFSDDPNLVFAGHNYGESIGDIPLEAVFAYFQFLADGYGTPLWIGEYGWFSDTPDNRERLERFSATEDSFRTAGATWWQWRQACGDPHSVGRPGGTPDPVLVHFQRNGCPGDVNLGVVPTWSCTWRPYARRAPGTVTFRVSRCEDLLAFTGTTGGRGIAEIWFPGRVRPKVVGTGILASRARRVPGGWSVAVAVQGDYAIIALV